MSTPDLAAVLKRAETIVFQARKEGNLGSLTARLIRQKLEGLFSLEAGTFDAPEYKKPLKDAIAAAIQKPREELDDELEPENEVKKTAKRKRKVVAEGEEEGEVKPKAKTQKKDATKPPRSRGRPTSRSKSAKSAEVVEDSDGDEDVKPTPASKPAEEKDASEDEQPKSSSSKPRSPPKSKSTSSRPSSRKFASADTIDLDDEGDETPAKPGKSQPKSTSKISDGGAEANNDVEMSDVIDEAPQKSKGRRKKPAPRTKRGQKSSQTLSKDEATIKRLKSFVAACGARKVWSKEFKGLDSPSQQISRLRAILAELGMSGRLSMEAARAIKEKREIEQELKDVQAFEKAVVSGRPFRTRDAGKARPKDEVDEDEGEDRDEDNEAVELPAKRKATRNARQSIMAFLGDQSDSE